MAEGIAEIAAAMKAVGQTRLSRRTIALLVRDQTNLSLSDIMAVFDSLSDLEKDYLKPE